MEYNYPTWLYYELIDDLLPWQQGKKMTFRQFNAKYTLHDTYGVGIFYDVAYQQSVILAIQWDAVWLSKEMKQNNSVIKEPYLFIRLTNVEQVSTAHYILLVPLVSLVPLVPTFPQSKPSPPHPLSPPPLHHVRRCHQFSRCSVRGDARET